MKLHEIPDAPKFKFTERIGVAVTLETKRKLEYLKSQQGKDLPEFLRTIIDQALKDINLDEAG